MRASILLLPLLKVILGVECRSSEGLDPKVPIYLGDVFWPPTMTFLAWLPSEPQEPAPKVHIPGLTKEDNCKEKGSSEDPLLDVSIVLLLFSLM